MDYKTYFDLIRDGKISLCEVTPEFLDKQLCETAVWRWAVKNCYILVNGEKAHDENPDFWMPPKSDRESLKIGDTVWLSLGCRANGEVSYENIWVDVTVSNQNYYKGKISANPDHPNLKLGQSVYFLPRNVVSIY